MATKRFTGKVAIVTGSSTGIGRGIAQLFAEEGAKITLTGRNEKSLNDARDLLISGGASEQDIRIVRGDIREESVQKKLINETVAKFGRIDVLVNNAGSLGPDNSVTQMGLSQGSDLFDYIMQLNVRTILTLSKLALPELEKTHGEIINMSSMAGTPIAFPSQPYYSVSKAAVSQLTRNMALEYISKGVRVNSVNPGLVTTDVTLRQGKAESDRDQAESRLAQEKNCIPCGYVGNVRDIAETVAFLADRSKSRYIVGHCLVIDGGSTLVNPLLAHEIFS